MVYTDAPAPPLVWRSWLVHAKGAPLKIQAGVDPIRVQSIASAPPDRKAWVEGEHYSNGSSGPRIVIRVDLAPVGNAVRVELRMIAYP